MLNALTTLSVLTHCNYLFDLTNGVLISVTLNTQTHQVEITGQHKTADSAIASRRFSVRPNKILHRAQSFRPEPSSAGADIGAGNPRPGREVGVEVEQHLEEGQLLRGSELHQRTVQLRQSSLAVLVGFHPVNTLGVVEVEAAHVHERGISPLFWAGS